MKLIRCFSQILLLLLVSISLPATLAQQNPNDPIIVGFVADNQTQTASVIDAGADGLTRLADIFQDYDATPRRIDLDNIVADDVDIIVLVGPRRRLPPNQIANLWLALERGVHLFAAFDPNGFQGVASEDQRSGLTNLLDTQYAIRLQEGMIVRPWYSRELLDDLDDSWTQVQPEDIIVHPITAPIRQFNLPIYVWGSRHLTIDGFSGSSEAIPLLYTSVGYAEANVNALNANARTEEPIEFNIGLDGQGRLLLAGIAVDEDSGSRMVLLGDGELTQNIYGLTRRNTATNLPRFPGNDVLLYRLVGWILGLPESEWLTLGEAFTQILLDGELDDWSETIPPFIDTALDVTPLSHDIQNLWLVQNDQFAYIGIETGAPITEEIQLGIRVTNGTTAMSLILQNDEFFMAGDGISPDVITDAAFGTGEHVELRIPRRLFGENYTVLQVCLLVRSAASADCLDEPMIPTDLTTIEPVPVRFSQEEPMGFIRSNGVVNLRVLPTTDGSIVGQVTNREVFAVIGRNGEGDWYQVRNGRYEGWVASFLIGINADPVLLPITVDSDVEGDPTPPDAESTEEPATTGS